MGPLKTRSTAVRPHTSPYLSPIPNRHIALGVRKRAFGWSVGCRAAASGSLRRLAAAAGRRSGVEGSYAGSRRGQGVCGGCFGSLTHRERTFNLEPKIKDHNTTVYVYVYVYRYTAYTIYRQHGAKFCQVLSSLPCIRAHPYQCIFWADSTPT